MNKIIAFLIIWLSAISPLLAKEIKVLTIGNSFAWSLKSYFAKAAKSAGDEIILGEANFGGCTLKRHWEYIQKEELEEDAKIYQNGSSKLRDILKSQDWDFISIHQASFESHKFETYEPYASNIIAYIKKYAPNAEIVIQQTWSYRADSPLLKEWEMTSADMFDALQNAYAKLAKKHGLRQIPMGEAVQIARANSSIKFRPPKDDELKTYNYPDLPRQAGDPVGFSQWKKRKDEMVIDTDYKHLNKYGEYLQACLWYAFVSGNSAKKITYVPKIMSSKDALFFQETADAALKADF